MANLVKISTVNDSKTILVNLFNAETTLKNADKAYFKAYFSEYPSIALLTEIGRKELVISLAKKSKLSEKTITNKIAMFKNAAKNKLDMAKIDSFRALELACKRLKDGSHTVVVAKNGKANIVFDTVKDAAKTAKSSEVISAKNDAILLIESDYKFMEFMKYAKESGMNLNYLRLAIK